MVRNGALDVRQRTHSWGSREIGRGTGIAPEVNMLHERASTRNESFEIGNKIMVNLHCTAVRLAVVILACSAATIFRSPAVADPPTTSTSSSELAAEESLDVRHARAHLELATLDLRRAQAWNKRIPGVFSDRTMDYLRKHVEMDSEQLKQALGSPNADLHEIYIRGAEAAVELADDDTRRKEAIQKSFPDEYNALELDRAIAVAKVAKLNLERTVAQKNSMHTLSHLQWQIEELRNQLLELQVKFEKSARH